MLMQEVAEPDISAESNPPPQVFVRAFTTPPGLPWEQARAAQLEARHGSPLAASELQTQLKRLTTWGPGRPGRYAAFYVRLRDYRGPFETTVDVDGRAIKVAFGAGAQQLERARLVGGALAVLVATGGVLGLGVALAQAGKRDAVVAQETLAQLSAGKLRQAQGYRRSHELARDLRRSVGESKPVSDVIADLAWAASAKRPEARIAAVHWDQGLLAIEVRGEEAPFEPGARELQRSDKPIRPGVWLWGLTDGQDGVGR